MCAGGWPSGDAPYIEPAWAWPGCGAGVGRRAAGAQGSKGAASESRHEALVSTCTCTVGAHFDARRRTRGGAAEAGDLRHAHAEGRGVSDKRLALWVQVAVEQDGAMS